MTTPSRAAEGTHSADALTKREPSTPNSLDDMNNQPRWFLMLINRGGVLPEAWKGWATIHERPDHVFILSNSMNIFAVLFNSFVMLFLSRPFRWDHHALSSVSVISHVSTVTMVWKHGPSITKTRTYIALGSILGLCQCIVATRLVIGPIYLVPFGNQLAFIATFSITMFAMTIGSFLGCWAAHHPPEPYRYAPALATCQHTHTKLKGCCL